MPLSSVALARALAPEGRLRAAINLGNPILTSRDPTTGEVAGVSIDLARALGRKLNLDVEVILFERAAESVAAVRAEQADVGFFAVDPDRADGVRFTAPYVLIEGSYLVREGRRCTTTPTSIERGSTLQWVVAAPTTCT